MSTLKRERRSPVVSVVVTTYNRYDHLMRCLRSIADGLEGVDFGYEVIVIDDHSSDRTKDLGRSDIGVGHAMVVHNEKRLMMVASRNVGARLSSGRFVLFIDDDNVIDKKMIVMLVNYAKSHDHVGIVGPSMHSLRTGVKYFEYQAIDFFTGRTQFFVRPHVQGKVYPSVGIPNVFLVRKDVLVVCDYFDEHLIQSFTEPDFALTAWRKGYHCVVFSDAITYHDVSINDYFNPSALGGKFKQKAYCLMRNRSVIIKRYGHWYNKVVYVLLFSWAWPVLYSILVLRYARFDLLPFYWRGYLDGMRYMFFEKLDNSLLFLMKGST